MGRRWRRKERSHWGSHGVEELKEECVTMTPASPPPFCAGAPPYPRSPVAHPLLRQCTSVTEMAAARELPKLARELNRSLS